MELQAVKTSIFQAADFNRKIEVGGNNFDGVSKFYD